MLHIAKLAIFSGLHKFSKKNFETVDLEDAAISDFAHLAGVEQLDVVTTNQRDGSFANQKPKTNQNRPFGLWFEAGA